MVQEVLSRRGKCEGDMQIGDTNNEGMGKRRDAPDKVRTPLKRIRKEARRVEGRRRIRRVRDSGAFTQPPI